MPTRQTLPLALLLSVSLLPATATAADGLKWHTDLRQAALEAQKSKKPMLIEITAAWCGHCKKMKETYRDKAIVKHVNGCFVPVSVDADRNQQLVDSVGADGLPTTVIVSHDFRLLKKITGFQTPDQLDDELGEICQAKHEVPARIVGKKPTTQAQTVGRQETEEVTAFEGFCLVALLDDRKMVAGSAEQTSVYETVPLRFSSPEYQKKFLASPLKYWPVLNGYCPVSLANDRKWETGNPQWSAIYRNRVWFFASQEARQAFAAAPKRFLWAVEENTSAE